MAEIIAVDAIIVVDAIIIVAAMIAVANVQRKNVAVITIAAVITQEMQLAVDY